MQTIMIFGRFGIFASMTSSSYDFWEIISLQLLANFIDYLCFLAQKMGSWGFPDRSGYPNSRKRGSVRPRARPGGKSRASRSPTIASGPALIRTGAPRKRDHPKMVRDREVPAFPAEAHE